VRLNGEIVLIRDDKKICSVYYSSHILHDAETKYLKVEKVVFALISVFKKLKLYFQAHKVIVLSNQPLRQILHKLEIFGCLVKWAIKLGEFGLQYRPQPVITGQTLVDFIVECSFKGSMNTSKSPHLITTSSTTLDAPIE
jgi:hypothetical protein